jgi:hypothetical protein
MTSAGITLYNDSPAAVATIHDDNSLVVHSVLRALSSSGLSIRDDGGNVGVFIEDGGNVGIRTTNPDSLLHMALTANAPTILHIQNTSTGSSAQSTFQAEVDAGSVRFGVGSSASAFDGGGFFYADNAVPLSFWTNNVERMRITGVGYVGIGTSTPGTDIAGTIDYAPASLLQVNSEAGEAGLLVRGSTKANFELIDNGAGASGRRFSMEYDAGTLTMGGKTDAGAFTGSRLVWQVAGSFFWEAAPLAGTVHSIASGGNAAGIEINDYGGLQPHIELRRILNSAAFPVNVASGTTIGQIVARGYTSGGLATNHNAEISFVATEDYNTGVIGKGGAEIRFFTRPNGGTTVAARLYILNNGAILLGAYLSGTVITHAGPANLFVDTDGTIKKVVSSLRYKENIADLPSNYGADLVMAMRPVTFDAKGGSTKGHVGFIAEEIAAIGGEHFIGRDTEGRPDAVHYDRLTAPIVSTLQGLIMRNRELEARIDELERRLN